MGRVNKRQAHLKNATNKSFQNKMARRIIDECIDKAINISIEKQSIIESDDNPLEIFSDEQIIPEQIETNTEDESIPDVYTEKEVIINSAKIDGLRIIDVILFFSQLQELNNHCPEFSCSVSNLCFIKEIKKGLMSTFMFSCNMCNRQFLIHSSENDINEDVVQGAMSTGIGFSQSEELFSVLDVPYMSKALYAKYHNKVCDAWELTAKKVMKESAEEEAEHAKQIVNVDVDGVPLITVVADGCWSKRSYRNNYSALSGAAAIVGQKTGKILYLAVKNKFCSICDVIPNPMEHICYKNYSGSSSGMESKIIVEGFKRSEEMYGIRYATMISDGDSSSYKKILESRPYKSRTVEKIEFRNHLLRNYCNKLKKLGTETRYPIKLRRLILKNILRLRRAVTSAIKYRRRESNINYMTLKEDIDNSIYHVFGEHLNCKEYFCKKDTTEVNNLEEFKNYPEMWDKLVGIVSYLSNHSKSSIRNVDSNIVEQFHSIVCKFVGGKRINFSRRRSYSGRCYGAVVSFNTKKPHTSLNEQYYGRQAPNLIQILENRKYNHSIKIQAKRRFYRARRYRTDDSKFDNNYGEGCEKPDIEPEILKMEKEKFLKSIELNEKEKNTLEKKTVHQRNDSFWMEERRKRLTASNFYNVCVRRKSTPPANLVRRILFTPPLNTPAINHGIKYEKHAIQQLSMIEKLKIEENGLFVHPKYPFLGATPDGTVGKNITVEIKCPFSAFGMDIKDAIEERKIKFWKKGKNEYIINKNHSWYYQIQGQLEVTNRETCIFGVWTGSDMKTIYIDRDREFWKSKMEEKLIKFYMNCLLPELVDSRVHRGMPIRDDIE